MPLTDTFIRQAKYSGAKAGDKHSDGGGLYLLVNAAGKYWRMNYRYLGKQKTLSLGVYPAVSLAAARKGRDQARELLAAGKDPSAEKQEAAKEATRAAGAVFETVARDWLTSTASQRSPSTHSRVVSWFERDVFPRIGQRQIDSLRPSDILDMMKKMQARGVKESAHRVLGYISKVFRMAMVAELVERDPTIGVGDTLEKPIQRHHAAITEPAEVGALMRAIHAYDGHPVTCAALKFAPLVFQRPHMVREAEWAEMDLDAAEWRIPSERMKMDNDHIVPLSRQAVAVLREVHKITGHGRYVFASLRPGRPMSDNTINAALRTLGYDKETMVGHGFRAMARTILDEVLGERVDLIEHQLAHAVKDVNGRAYNRTAHLPARRAMMQRWADYLDKLRLGADIVPLHPSAER
jgi:integrase